MQLTIEIPNEQLFDKVLQLLNIFKSDGLKIINHNSKKNNYIKNTKLQQFENLLNIKSRNSILLDKSTVLNPHKV